MASWSLSIPLLLLLLLSSTLLQAHSRTYPKKRPFTQATPFFPSPFAGQQQHHHDHAADDRSRLESKHQANEQQIEQFTRLLYDRLNLKEPPNVTSSANDGTGFPSSFVKQLEQQAIEQQRLHHDEELNSQKQHDESQATAERAILSGDSIASYPCQRQLGAKLNVHDKHLRSMKCFRFTKSNSELRSLPTNQPIKRLRIYVKQNFFYPTDSSLIFTPEMFQIYQVFRPTSNDTSGSLIASLTGTQRLSVSQVKPFNDNWLELTVSPAGVPNGLQQIYEQFIMPWHGLALSRELQTPGLADSWPTYRRHHHPRLHDDEEKAGQKQEQLPYMLVEYDQRSLSLRRGTRADNARPARACDPKSPCCRRSLTIDLDQGQNALNFVIYPRKIDIGECVGLCGASGSSLKLTDAKNAQYKNEHHSGYNFFLLHQHQFSANRTQSASESNKADPSSAHCCSYSNTGGLEMLYRTTNDGPIIRKYIPNMVVERCRCGLPATIQQVY